MSKHEHDPVLEAVEMLETVGIAAIPFGDDLENWQIGDLTYEDADVLRLAERVSTMQAQRRRSDTRSLIALAGVLGFVCGLVCLQGRLR